jgi:DNA-binding response OmpR family regulator
LIPGLSARGFEVEGFAHPTGLYRRLLVVSFDVVVLDIGLPEEHGLSVARQLRAGSPIGIVVLTGRGDRAEQLRGLDEAADAWLTKPVDMAIVAATIGSLLRRVSMVDTGLPADSATDAIVMAAQWRLSAGGWKLLAPSGRAIDLSRSERCILQRLFAAGGEPVPREVLIDELGEPVDSFDPHRLEMLIHRLRRKVADGLGEVLPLRSVRGLGYVLTV